MAMKEHCAFPPKGYRGRTNYEGEKKKSQKNLNAKVVK